MDKWNGDVIPTTTKNECWPNANVVAPGATVWAAHLQVASLIDAVGLGFVAGIAVSRNVLLVVAMVQRAE